jgi:hypothetical protein
MAKQGVELHKEEEVIGLIRRSRWMYAWSFTIGALWILLPIVLFFPLIRLGWFGWGLLVVGLLTGFVYLFAVRSRWHETILLITNERIVDIDRSHWRRRFVYEWPVHDVGKVTVESGGFILGLLRLKTLQIAMKNPKLRIEFHGVKKAERVKQLLDEVQSL